jgi:hypothetical protein
MLAVYILLCVVILAVLFTQQVQHFQTRESVLTTSLANHGVWVMQYNQTLNPIPVDNLNGAPGQLIVSTSMSPSNDLVLAEKKGYFVSIASPELAFHIDCGFDFGGMRIGYFDDIDLRFINALISGYRMDTSAIKIIKIPAKQALTLATRLATPTKNGDFDLVVTFVIPDSPFHKMLQAQRISVMGFQRLDIDRVHVFEPQIDLEEVSLKRVFFNLVGSGTSTVMARENVTKLPTVRAQLVRIKAAPGFEPFAAPDTDPYLDPSYRCVGDETVNIRALCESAYDVNGQKKKKQTIWDKPCKMDIDCAFYDSSQKRGGCQKDGYCEMPVAVKRIGFRQYDASGVYAPFKKDGKVVFPDCSSKWIK